MFQKYYKGTLCKLEAYNGEIIYDRIIADDVIIYDNLLTPYCDFMTDCVFNTKDIALDLIFSEKSKYAMATYLDEASIVPISYYDAASALLAQGYLGESFAGILSEKEVGQVLKKAMHLPQ